MARSCRDFTRLITNDNGLRIAEFTERAGLTVRTLHHYDQIGLVRASERRRPATCATEADVRRLYQVVALRFLGVPLALIARALEGDGFTLKDAVTAVANRSPELDGSCCMRG